MQNKVIQADLYIPAYSGIFRHIQKLFGHIHTYSEPCVTLAYLEPGIFRNLAYSEPQA